MIFWNEDVLDDTQGLDILGIRAFGPRYGS
jgi:hypothetical protein